MFGRILFGEQRRFWHLAGALLIHLLPTALILLVVAAAWGKEWIGGIVFLGPGVLDMTTAWGQFPLSVYFVIAGPLIATGLLFRVSSIHRSRTPIEEQS